MDVKEIIDTYADAAEFSKQGTAIAKEKTQNAYGALREIAKNSINKDEFFNKLAGGELSVADAFDQAGVNIRNKAGKIRWTKILPLSYRTAKSVLGTCLDQSIDVSLPKSELDKRIKDNKLKNDPDKIKKKILKNLNEVYDLANNLNVNHLEIAEALDTVARLILDD